MKDFILYIAQSGICLSFFGVVYFLFLRRQTFFRFNRVFLLVGLLISFILPSIQFSYDVVIAALPISIISNVVTGNLKEEVVGISMWQVLTIVYSLGIGVIFVRNIRIFWNLYRLKQSGVVYTTKRYRLIDSEEIKMPFSILNNVFINTSKLQGKEKEIILKHEISHIDQKHWIDLLCSECALLLQWFNPLVWYYIHLLKENHEFLADQAVLNDGESTVVYRAVLINQRFQGPVFSFANSFNYSNQQNRLNMMKKTKTSPWKKFGVLAVLPLIGAFFALSAKPNYVMQQIETESSRDSLVVVGYADDKTVVEVGGTAIEVREGKFLKEGEGPLIVVDAKVTDLEMKDVDSDLVESVEVFKDAKTLEEYGAKGKNGVIKVTLKKGAKLSPQKEGIYVREITTPDGENFTLIIDGEEVAEGELNKLETKDVESFSVLKDKSATEVYGAKGKNGVILVETKKKGDKSKMVTKTTYGGKTLAECLEDIEELGDLPLLIVDEVDKGRVKPKDIQGVIGSASVNQWSVITRNSEKGSYGEKAKDGVVKIETESGQSKRKDAAEKIAKEASL